MKTFTHEDIANLFNFTIDFEFNFEEGIITSIYKIFQKDFFIFRMEKKSRPSIRISGSETDGIYLDRGVNPTDRLKGGYFNFYDNLGEFLNKNPQTIKMLNNLEVNIEEGPETGDRMTVLKMSLERMLEEEQRVFDENCYYKYTSLV